MNHRRFLTFVLLIFLTLCCFSCVHNGYRQETTGTFAETEAGPEPVTFTVSPTDPYPVKLPETPEDVAALIWLLTTEADAVKDNRSDLTELAYIGYCSLSEEDRARIPDADKLPALRDDAAKLNIVKKYSDTRIDHSRLQIGTYWVRLADPEHLAEIKDCGFDFVWQPPGGAENLRNFYDAGLGVMEFIGEMFIPTRLSEDCVTPEGLAEYDRILEGQWEETYPAVWGFYQMDEPSAAMFDIIKKNGEILKKHMPGMTHIINLFPGTAADFALGGEGNAPIDYETYINVFADPDAFDMICYDHYLYDSHAGFAGAIKNLITVSETADRNGMDFWIILAVYGKTGPLTTEQLKLQAYTAMAYGTENISYACWTADGWGSSSVLTKSGAKTVTYDRLKETVADLKAFSPIYMKYSHESSALLIGADYYNRTDIFPSPQYGKIAETHGPDSLGSEKFTSVSVSDNEFAIAGLFKKKTGTDGEGLFIINCTDYQFKKESRATVSFTVSDDVSVVTAYEKGIPRVLTPENGVYSVISSGADAVFVTAE
ncbi:MAG: hypothetical protein J6Z80_03530 [Clostridia bacterium]|nr:hypothetical protein [Clostridia bacterium]